MIIISKYATIFCDFFEKTDLVSESSHKIGNDKIKILLCSRIDVIVDKNNWIKEDGWFFDRIIWIVWRRQSPSEVNRCDVVKWSKRCN